MRNEYNIVELRECWEAEKLYKSLWKVRNRKEIKILILILTRNRENIVLALARLVISLFQAFRLGNGAKKSEQEKTKKGCECPKNKINEVQSKSESLQGKGHVGNETHTTLTAN